MSDDALDIRHLIVNDFGDFHPSEANGLHQVARSLVAEQNMAGDHARIFCIPSGPVSAVPKSTSDVPVHALSFAGTRFGRHLVRMHPGHVREVLRDVTPRTVFHLHGVRLPVFVGFSRLLRARSIPYVVTAHSRYAHIFGADRNLVHYRTAAYVYALERPFLEAARCVHVLTADEDFVMSRLAPRARTELVGNGVFSSARMVAAPQAASVPPRSANGPIFGYFGRLAIEHKGLDALVQGFAHYRSSGGSGTLEIIGSGDGAREVLAGLRAATPFASDIHLFGPRFGKEKDELVKRWSYFALPSRFDRSPLAALEAALSGLPLLVTRETGLPFEQYGAGIPIETATPQAVSAAMHTAAGVSPEQWSQQAANGIKMALETSDWTLVARKLRPFYASEQPARDGNAAHEPAAAPGAERLTA